MENPKKYGTHPYETVTVHGGPGAAGEMSAFAKKLSVKRGVLEPLQTGLTVKSQLEELAGIIIRNGTLPVVVIGHSWGAWLSLMLAAKHPEIVKKIILVSSGPFQKDYALSIHAVRMNRLNAHEREEAEHLFSVIESGDKNGADTSLKRIGVLFRKTDSYLPRCKDETADINSEIFSAIWPEAAKMRDSGELLSVCRHVRCPVTAIHGDFDPHPADGVKMPLEKTVKNFKFVLLQKCGHKPWIEKAAEDEFYRVVEDELDALRG